MSGWSYYRDSYCKRAHAVEMAKREMLADPRMQHAIHQIAAMEAFIDVLMEAAMDEDEE